MPALLAYMLGIATPGAVFLLGCLLAWLLDRNLEVTCGKCGRIFGELPTTAHIYGRRGTFTRVTRARLRWHRLTAHRR